MRNNNPLIQKAMKNNFLTVKIYCKPVVKSYLEKNFGNPVTIPDEHILNKLACAQLFKGNTRPNFFKEYTESIELNICERNFDYDGFNINDMNTRNFNTGVTHFIKVLCETNLDSLLLLHDKQLNWKSSFLDLINMNVKSIKSLPEVTKLKKELEKELGDHQFTIKKAIKHVVCDCLKLDFETLKYDTVKKNYYRYRLKKFHTQKSPDIYINE